eukprot:TRINITY_DN4446_c0_g2_i2.p1 TRINITY_DN4446_c0_g2~~TRINITY_DN4446_c0_g2_i2.p1  ORF type:complete len:352 (-),score=22.22 TRINITY_DN4446_c0_g2_i2:449-1504(-)
MQDLKFEEVEDKKLITVNVGGKLFQTTPESLARADPNSILWHLLRDDCQNDEPQFFDRDPVLFRSLLRILRSKESLKLPQTLETLKLPDTHLPLQALVEEARFFGAETALKNALKSPELNGLNLTRKALIIPNGRDFPSAMAAGADGSLNVAHGNKITWYDWSISKRETAITSFSCMDSLVQINGENPAFSSSLLAAGAVDRAGLYIYDMENGVCREIVHWRIPEAPEIVLHDPTVQAAATGRGRIFAAFESSRKNANTILVIDSETLGRVSETGRQLGGAADLLCPTKLDWIESQGLLLASTVSGAPYGHKAVLRVFDVRASNEVWKSWESTSRSIGSDCFVDIVWSEGF